MIVLLTDMIACLLICSGAMAYDRFAYGYARWQWHMIALLTDMLGSNGI